MKYNCTDIIWQILALFPPSLTGNYSSCHYLIHTNEKKWSICQSICLRGTCTLECSAGHSASMNCTVLVQWDPTAPFLPRVSVKTWAWNHTSWETQAQTSSVWHFAFPFHYICILSKASELALPISLWVSKVPENFCKPNFTAAFKAFLCFQIWSREMLPLQVY